MSTARVDQLNIVLMLISCTAAFLLPFELFLFSYAVLGPLHYVTQISWLHDRKYFSPDPRALLLLGGLAALTTLANLGPPIWLKSQLPPLAFVAFGCGLLVLLKTDGRAKLGTVALLLFVGWLLRENHQYRLIFVFLMSTLIHVFVFTGCFILYGALRNQSTWSAVSLAVFAGCGVSFWIFQPDPGGYVIAEYAQRSYDVSLFPLNLALIREWSPELLSRASGLLDVQQVVYGSATGQALARFIAFAYTYHYLNWFSKTSVIGWHQVSRARLAVSLLIWVAALALYAYDYSVGLSALLFLSMLHVYLEFPLNWLTFKNIGLELRHRLPA